jgi:hypothetical protein
MRAPQFWIGPGCPIRHYFILSCDLAGTCVKVINLSSWGKRSLRCPYRQTRLRFQMRSMRVFVGLVYGAIDETLDPAVFDERQKYEFITVWR